MPRRDLLLRGNRRSEMLQRPRASRLKALETRGQVYARPSESRSRLLVKQRSRRRFAPRRLGGMLVLGPEGDRASLFPITVISPEHKQPGVAAALSPPVVMNAPSVTAGRSLESKGGSSHKGNVTAPGGEWRPPPGSPWRPIAFGGVRLPMCGPTMRQFPFLFNDQVMICT